MAHFEVAAFVVNLSKTEALQCCDDLLKAGAVSQCELDDLTRCALLQLFRIRLQVELDGFPDVLESFLARASLGPAALERGAMGDDEAVFARFEDHFQFHGSTILAQVSETQPHPRGLRLCGSAEATWS